MEAKDSGTELKCSVVEVFKLLEELGNSQWKVERLNGTSKPRLTEKTSMWWQSLGHTSPGLSAASLIWSSLQTHDMAANTWTYSGRAEL